MTRYFAASLATAFLAVAPPAAAQDACTADGDPYDLDAAAVEALYGCMEARLAEGYASGDDEVAAAYRSWTVTSTRPGVAGPHGERFLQTFANETGAEQYLAYEQGDFEMPVGSVLAKESFALNDGTAQPGPLFIMTKVEDAAEFDNWLYSAVQPNGQPMNVSQNFCHDCHVNFEDSDSMGYPLEEVRVSASN